MQSDGAVGRTKLKQNSDVLVSELRDDKHNGFDGTISMKALEAGMVEQSGQMRR